MFYFGSASEYNWHHPQWTACFQHFSFFLSLSQSMFLMPLNIVQVVTMLMFKKTKLAAFELAFVGCQLRTVFLLVRLLSSYWFSCNIGLGPWQYEIGTDVKWVLNLFPTAMIFWKFHNKFLMYTISGKKKVFVKTEKNYRAYIIYVKHKMFIYF